MNPTGQNPEPSPVPTPVPAQPKAGLTAKKRIGLLAGIVAALITVLVVIFFAMRTGTAGPVEIVWWGLWEDASIVEPLVAEYEAANPGVDIRYEKQSKEDYRERLVNSLNRGTGPDIMRIHNTWTPMFATELASLPSDVMSPQEFAETFYPAALSDMSTAEGIVGIPLEYDGLALYINEDIFSAFAKTPPRTWDELRRTALELTIRDSQGNINQAGAALGSTQNVDHWEDILALMMIQNGANLAEPVGEFAEGALNFYTVFTRTDNVWDETLPPSTAAFAGGKVAMYFAPSWRAFEINRLNPNLAYRVISVPQLPKVRPNDPDVTYASYWYEGVWARGKHQKEAWKFLKFMSSREALEKLYLNASQTRAFGEPYPRVDMRQLLLQDPVVSGFIELAPNARSWFLASRTFDGETGLNSVLSGYFKDAVNTVRQSGEGRAEFALQTAAAGVQQTLVRLGLVSPPVE